MKLTITVLAFALVATTAFATDPPAPPKPVEHAIKLTDADLQVLTFVVQHTGERCAQDQQYCQAQIMLNDLAKRVQEQIAGEAKPK